MPSPQYPESPSSHSPAFLWPSHHQLRLLLSLLSNWPPCFQSDFSFFLFFFLIYTIARITLSTQSQTLSLLSSNSCKAPLHSAGKPESWVIYTAPCTLAFIPYYIWQPHFLFLYFAWSAWSTLHMLTWTHRLLLRLCTCCSIFKKCFSPTICRVHSITTFRSFLTY